MKCWNLKIEVFEECTQGCYRPGVMKEAIEQCAAHLNGSDLHTARVFYKGSESDRGLGHFTALSTPVDKQVVHDGPSSEAATSSAVGGDATLRRSTRLQTNQAQRCGDSSRGATNSECDESEYGENTVRGTELTLDSLLWNRGRGRLKGRRIAVKFSNNDGSAEGWFRATVESNHREDGVECLRVRYDVDHDSGDEASNTLRISKEGGHDVLWLQHGDGSSAEAVSQEIFDETGVDVPPSTITRMCRQGKIGRAPGKRGKPRYLPDCLFELAHTFAQMQQVDKTADVTPAALRRKVLAAIIGSAAEAHFARNKNGLPARRFIDKCIQRATIGMDIVSPKNVEARRNLHTTYTNMRDWLDGWKEVLLKHGFAEDKPDPETGASVTMVEGALSRILNWDETHIEMDSTKVRRGSNYFVLVDPDLPRAGSPACKTATHVTLVMGSTADGQPLIPMIVFPTDAKIPENRKIDILSVLGLPTVTGTWGLGAEKTFKTVVAVTPSGGMDNDLVKHYVDNCLRPLYPVDPATGKMPLPVLVKQDSGPGRFTDTFVNERSGFLFVQTVPYTTQVSQEMVRACMRDRQVMASIFMDRMHACRIRCTAPSRNTSGTTSRPYCFGRRRKSCQFTSQRRTSHAF